ncbi:MAG: DNA mismatch repair protein MutS [Cyclobacteriaceae bacterium]|nr:DNA mismatch repair protein MutS [Cyclobacteriaceae bacterium]
MAKGNTAAAKKETPLMKQYNQVKARYPGALLLFRVGDFYETFGEDAIRASKVLDIVLTRRANGAASHIELAGFPHHALDSYLPKLVRAGYRVAICDQLEDPKMVKGIVKRGVTELVTPGVALNDNVLEGKVNNFLASIYFNDDKSGVAFLDISTGEFLTSAGNYQYIENLVQSLNPAEIIYAKPHREIYLKSFGEKSVHYALEDWIYTYDFAYEKLTTHFHTLTLKGFGIDNLAEGIIAAGAILFYLDETEHKDIGHITSISRIEEDHYVWLDKFTIRNLELVRAQQEDGVPLIEVLDKTVTPMGARTMKKWILLPLKDTGQIEERLNIVESLLKKEDLHEKILKYMKGIGDLERLISKVAVKRINPREMIQLKRALLISSPLREILKNSGNPALKTVADQIEPCTELTGLIENRLKEDAPMLTHQGGVIAEGVHEELDELRKIAYSGKDYLIQIQKREVRNTGISSLKIAYNKVFGYYLEVTHAHKDKVPSTWIRKQTLVNAERYITEELKTYEEKILHAEEKIITIEQKLYAELVAEAASFVNRIQKTARILGQLDCLSSFALSARENNYTKPAINTSTHLIIKNGRHPVIEKQLPLGEPYIPNDIYLNNESHQILIITGPNMAGKSALLRQVALIVLMAQMGSFVPASNAEIGIVDKIFTRVGASDNLSRGESTFMVEMTETASILNNLNNRSLVLMDEIGRGTSTYDGVSIAWSIVEYLQRHPKFRVKTLFATHYHELNQLADDFPGIKNFNVTVKEVGNRILFLRKLKEGGSEHSFGIHVAQMAGIPNPIVIRANEILRHLEKEKLRENHKKRVDSIPKNNYQLSLFEADPKFEEIKQVLDQLDINTISPVEALLKLNEIKTIMKGR